MITYRALFLLLTISKFTQSEDCILKAPIEDAWDKVLHGDLLHKNYDPSEPPRNESCVPVEFKATLLSVSIDGDKSVFSAHVKTKIEWHDERLAWSPAAYGGLKKMILSSDRIWKPTLRIVNSVVSNYNYNQFNDCKVINDGKVTCQPDINFKSLCRLGLKWWPYDMQYCILEVDKDEFGVVTFSFSISPLALENKNSWTVIIAVKPFRSSYEMHFFVSRTASGLFVIVVVPCIIVALLTLASTLMNPKGRVRLGFLCFSLLSHFVFVRAIKEFLPRNTPDDTPLIILFVKDSSIVTIISILFTHCLSALMKKENEPFWWVSLITSKMLDSFGKYLIFPRWIADLKSNTINAKNNVVWVTLGNILNTIYVVVSVAAYVALFYKYIPIQKFFFLM